MLYPLAICSICIVTSIIGTYFVKLGSNNSIMGALYKGLIVTRRAVDRRSRASQPSSSSGWGEFGEVAGKAITGTNLFICGVVGLVVTAADRLHHRVLHGHGKRPVVSIARRRSPATAPT
jgi:K(+)-stimulated pyrophosphate-energized sodium pump